VALAYVDTLFGIAAAVLRPSLSARFFAHRGGGRDHWPQAGFAMFVGGGLKMGHVVGATDCTASLPTTRPYSPQNVLATLYHVLGIDPATTLPDHNGRPVHLLDEREPIVELI
jgi:hypothetical protein